MGKIWTIAWKEIYTTFTDRSLILIMIATPLAISTIVGLAFGGLGSDDVPIQDIPVAVLNHDQGGEFGVNYGRVYVDILVPSSPGGEQMLADLGTCEWVQESEGGANAGISLFDLTEAVEFDQMEADRLIAEGIVEAPSEESGSSGYLETVSRAAVDLGEYVAVIIIEEDFTDNLTYIPVVQPRVDQTGVTVYANAGSPISAGVINSIVDGITNQIATGNIAIAATFGEMEERLGVMALGQAASSMDMDQAFACAFNPVANTIGLDLQQIETTTSSNISAIILVSVGSAQAMFFALFTAQFGVLSIHEEKRGWTLQRLIMSPTPRSSILGGKLIGVFLTVLFQLLMLMISLTIVGSLLQGEFVLIWGENYGMIALVMVSASLAVSGLGMLMAGIAKSPEQASVYATVLNMGLAVLGGAFGFDLPREISQFSLLYWGRNAFDQLAAGNSDILLNVVVLVGQGVIMYLIGLLLFNRRFESV